MLERWDREDRVNLIVSLLAEFEATRDTPVSLTEMLQSLRELQESLAVGYTFHDLFLYSPDLLD
ncbi:MAG: hypothetical protein ACE5R4_17085, partial [Armatimonadota bacterium]